MRIFAFDVRCDARSETPAALPTRPVVHLLTPFRRSSARTRDRFGTTALTHHLVWRAKLAVVRRPCTETQAIDEKTHVSTGGDVRERLLVTVAS